MGRGGLPRARRQGDLAPSRLAGQGVSTLPVPGTPGLKQPGLVQAPGDPVQTSSGHREPGSAGASGRPLASTAAPDPAHSPPTTSPHSAGNQTWAAGVPELRAHGLPAPRALPAGASSLDLDSWRAGACTSSAKGGPDGPGRPQRNEVAPALRAGCPRSTAAPSSGRDPVPGARASLRPQARRTPAGRGRLGPGLPPAGRAPLPRAQGRPTCRPAAPRRSGPSEPRARDPRGARARRGASAGRTPRPRAGAIRARAGAGRGGAAPAREGRGGGGRTGGGEGPAEGSPPPSAPPGSAPSPGQR